MAGGGVQGGGTQKKARLGGDKGGSGWKVLQDDLLVGSSLKDWDKDNSDSSSGGDEDGDDDE